MLLINVFHVFSLFALLALCGLSFAVPFAPALRVYKRPILMLAGLASAAVFLSGFALLGMLKYGMPIWAVVKALCWLALSALGGMIFKFPEKWRIFSGIGGAAVALALLMVFFKPGS